MLRAKIAALFALAVAGSASAEDMLPSQVNFDRPGGAYVVLPAGDARACAAQCARDGLCLAWSFAAEISKACALKAVITPARAAPGVVSGLAARAPRFASLVGAELSAPIAAPTRSSPVKSVRSAPAAPAADKYGLLGGPDDPL